MNVREDFLILFGFAVVRSAMAEVPGDGGATLSVSGSFKEGRGSARRRGGGGGVRPPSMDADEFMNLLHGSDPVKVELNRLENEVRGKKMQLDPKCSSP